MTNVGAAFTDPAGQMDLKVREKAVHAVNACPDDLQRHETLVLFYKKYCKCLYQLIKKLIPINKPFQIFSHERGRNVGLAIFVAPSGYSSTENMLLDLNGHIGAPKCIERVHVLI